MTSETALPDYVKRLKSKRSKGLYAEILAYLNKEQRYRDRTLTSAKLAKALNTNVRYVSAVIQANTGENYNALINRMRLRDIERMFRSRRYDKHCIEEIIVMSGFTSRQAFYKFFKKYLGTTPNEYRANLYANR